tara:strand:+ start:198 stop:458 length:261 start_codon:yes stop_codon:yes gene_type:complete
MENWEIKEEGYKLRLKIKNLQEECKKQSQECFDSLVELEYLNKGLEPYTLSHDEHGELVLDVISKLSGFTNDCEATIGLGKNAFRP